MTVRDIPPSRATRAADPIDPNTKCVCGYPYRDHDERKGDCVIAGSHCRQFRAMRVEEPPQNLLTVTPLTPAMLALCARLYAHARKRRSLCRRYEKWAKVAGLPPQGYDAMPTWWPRFDKDDE